MGISPAAAGLLGGMSGGIAQAYATMGEYSPSIRNRSLDRARYYDQSSLLIPDVEL